MEREQKNSERKISVLNAIYMHNFETKLLGPPVYLPDPLHLVPVPDLLWKENLK